MQRTRIKIDLSKCSFETLWEIWQYSKYNPKLMKKIQKEISIKLTQRKCPKCGDKMRYDGSADEPTQNVRMIWWYCDKCQKRETVYTKL